MKSFLNFLLVCVISAPASAGWFTNAASADAFVRANGPTANYGGAGALNVSGTTATNASGVVNGLSDIFIRFNTAAMTANFDSLLGTTNWVINGANLRVTEVGAPNNAIFNRGKGRFEIRWVANTNWEEGVGTPMSPGISGIVYTNEPGLLNVGADATLGTYTNAGTDFTHSYPLALPAGFVTSLKASGEVGLFLTAVDSGVGFTVDARSFGTVSARPFLEISALPQPGIAGMELAGPTVTLLCTNGLAGGVYCALTSTNVAAPPSQWQPAVTNMLIANGNFTLAITNGSTGDLFAVPHFFRLQTQ